MSLPSITLTWKQLLTSGVPGLRIPYASLADATQNTLFHGKDFLVSSSGGTTKPTLLWSAAGGTGPTNSADHTDRWTSAAAVTPRATTTAASQAWAVIVLASGVQVLLSWTGTSDDIFRVAFSPGALYTLAGTTNNCPTATDEQVVTTTASTSMVGSTTSGDRILHLWADDAGNGFRCVVMRAGTMVSPAWGVESFEAGVTSPASIPTSTWGFCFSRANMVPGNNPGINTAYSQGSSGGLLRSLVSSVGYSCQVVLGTELGPAGVAAPTTYTYQPELQGAGFTPYPVGMHTNNATGSRGRVGNLTDWWACAPSGVVDGDGLGNAYQLMQINGVLWPNPSAQAPTVT